MAQTGTPKKIDVELWKRWREQNDTLAERLIVEQYINLVSFVVNRLAVGLPQNVDRDDLASYGRFGLLDAMQKFDYERGLQFETYAMWRIRGSIMDGLRGADILPRSVREKAKKVEEAYQSLEQKLQRTVTDAEICEYLGITEAELSRFFLDTSFASLVSLDEPVQDEEDQKNVRQSFIVDERAPDPQKALDQNIQKEMLVHAIEQLSEKERIVVSLFYYEELTLTEIAEVMSLSPSRISQIHTKALLRIKTMLQNRLKV